MTGKLYGLGTGPGDPELLTLKAARILAKADIIAHFAKRGRISNARRIVANHIRPNALELPLLYPVTTEIEAAHPDYRVAITTFYEESAATVASHLAAGRDVVVLSEGDPLFYGSYMHLHIRLAPHYTAEVVPGVTAMSGCWSQAGVPITQGDDILTVLPGTLPEERLAQELARVDAAVIMKVGRNLPKIRRALTAAGLLSRAIYVERGTMANGGVTLLSEKPDDEAPYFSLILVPGWAVQP
ncbi:precorrin-2 C(20)-methyltransferase [Acetobacteraceae bacterium H6797]|nr:precorrin-2 C(20)-methyltransferase [Acetobacteraceae bacterium H6797]